MILPNTFISDSLEVYFSNQHSRWKYIYWVVLLFFTCILVALPITYVTVGITGNGLVRPMVERTEVKSEKSETIDSVFVVEGQYVKKGTPLLKLRTNDVNATLSFQQEMANNQQAQIKDLQLLVAGSTPRRFHSAVRKQEYLAFNRNKAGLKTAVEQSRCSYSRYKILFEKSLVSAEEYEKYAFDYENKQNELKAFVEKQYSLWQSDLNTLLVKADETGKALLQTRTDKNRYVLRSPVSGTLEQFSGIYPGSAVQAGQTLATISPSSRMTVEVYVSPKDIGFIHVGQRVNIQVEAFNYNEWGMLHAVVSQVSDDYVLVGGSAPHFRIRCELNTNYLSLRRTGIRGYLRKGMTVRAHFVVARRSLLNLLYDKMDNWLNPTQNVNSSKR